MPETSTTTTEASANPARPEKVRFGYAFLRFICRVIYRVYFRGRVFNRRHVPSGGPVLLVANHQSFLDPPIAAHALDRECGYIARDTLFRNPLIRRFFFYLNAFPVRRGAADVNAVKELLRRLKDGKAVLIFPEATRTRDGTIGQINANSLAVAKRVGVPIVPTLIDGAFEALPRGAKFPRPRRLTVYYAEPVTAEQVEAWPVEKIVEVVTTRLHDAQLEVKNQRKGN